MATVDDRTSESAISSKAYSLLDCFVDGLDEVVYEMAEEIAKNRVGRTGELTVPVRIEADDVKQAGGQIIEYLRQLVATGKAPRELATVLDGMAECLAASSK